MVCVKSERRFASRFATRRRSEALDNTGAHCTNSLVLSCSREQKWLTLPQEAFGLRLQSHPQGLAFSDKAALLHIVVFPTAPEQISFDDLGNLLVRDLQGMVWLLRVQHNNLPVTFRDLLAPETCRSPSTLRRLSWRATSCITIDFWRCLLCLPIDFFECRPKRPRPSLLALSPRAFKRAATT